MKKPEAKNKKCPLCDRAPHEGCSRVECPSRRQVTAAPWGSHQLVTGGQRQLPTTREFDE